MNISEVNIIVLNALVLFSLSHGFYTVSVKDLREKKISLAIAN